MSLLLLRIMLGMGIVGHALNMYCDRILSIFPNGTINFSNIKEITEGDNAAKLMEGASEKIPMRSAVWGAFAIVLEFFGYSALGVYTYGYSKIYGSVMLAATAFFCITAAAYHVKTALAEYAFLNLGRNADGKKMMLDLLNTAPVLRVCAVGLVLVLAVYVIVVVTGVIGFPIWALIFTILPIVIVMFPFRIIGTLHIGAMVSMLGWMLLL